MSKLIGSAIMETVLGKDSKILSGEFNLQENYLMKNWIADE